MGDERPKHGLDRTHGPEAQVVKHLMKSSTESPTAVTHCQLPQNVACGFPALRYPDDESQHDVLLQPRKRRVEFIAEHRRLSQGAYDRRF